MSQPDVPPAVDLLASVLLAHVDHITAAGDGAELSCSCQGFTAPLRHGETWDAERVAFRRHRSAAVLKALAAAGMLTAGADVGPGELTDLTGSIGDAEYRLAMDMIGASVRTLRLLPVDRLRAIVAQAETLGPILEPTAYVRGGGDNLRDQSELLAAVASLVAVAERIEARAGVRR